MAYDPKFDAKRPQPGDKEMAAAIRRGIEEAKSPKCNLCGESTYLGEHTPESGLDAVVSGGYDSTAGNGHGALDDMASYQFTLCEFCLDWLMSQFRIPPLIVDYGTGDDLGEFRPAAERVEKDSWRKMRDVFFTEKNKRDALRGKK